MTLPRKKSMAGIKTLMVCAIPELAELTGIPEEWVHEAVVYGSRRMPNGKNHGVTGGEFNALLMAMTVVCGPHCRLTIGTCLQLLRYGVQRSNTRTLWLIEQSNGCYAYGQHSEYENYSNNQP